MVVRPNVNYPKFKDQFAAMDFEAEPLPVLSLYPMPETKALEDWDLRLTDITGKTSVATWEHLEKLPKVQEPMPLVCQIFNWSETPVVTGVRLPVLMEAMGLDSVRCPVSLLLLRRRYVLRDLAQVTGPRPAGAAGL